ncbi:hypothetical protein Ruko_23050 [Ruthenibacterium sp. TH_2024_36131]
MRGYAGACGGVLSGAQAGRVNTGRHRYGAAMFCYWIKNLMFFIKFVLKKEEQSITMKVR